MTLALTTPLSIITSSSPAAAAAAGRRGVRRHIVATLRLFYNYSAADREAEYCK